MSPIFDYLCKRCKFEIKDKLFFTDKKSITCPNCGSTANRVMCASNFVIHGFSENNSYQGDNNGKK